MRKDRLRVGDVLPGGNIVIKVQRHSIHKKIEAFVGDPRRREPVIVSMSARPRPETIGFDLLAAAHYWFRRAGENYRFAKRSRSQRTKDLWMNINRRQLGWSKRIAALAKKGLVKP